MQTLDQAQPRAGLARVESTSSISSRMNSSPRPLSGMSPRRVTRGTNRPVSITSNASAPGSSVTTMRTGSSGELEPCWIALVTASLSASLTW